MTSKPLLFTPWCPFPIFVQYSFLRVDVFCALENNLPNSELCIWDVYYHLFSLTLPLRMHPYSSSDISTTDKNIYLLFNKGLRCWMHLYVTKEFRWTYIYMVVFEHFQGTSNLSYYLILTPIFYNRPSRCNSTGKS